MNEGRSEWVACIARTVAGKERFNWCGRRHDGHNRFVSIDHAAENLGRYIPCPDCVRNVIDALKS
jgi:hypothetical protein